MPNLSMERCRGTRPAVDFRPAPDHVLGIKTLWLKSYLLQISEMLFGEREDKKRRKREENRINCMAKMWKNCADSRIT